MTPERAHDSAERSPLPACRPGASSWGKRTIGAIAALLATTGEPQPAGAQGPSTPMTAALPRRPTPNMSDDMREKIRSALDAVANIPSACEGKRWSPREIEAQRNGPAAATFLTERLIAHEGYEALLPELEKMLVLSVGESQQTVARILVDAHECGVLRGVLVRQREEEEKAMQEFLRLSENSPPAAAALARLWAPNHPALPVSLAISRHFLERHRELGGQFHLESALEEERRFDALTAVLIEAKKTRQLTYAGPQAMENIMKGHDVFGAYIRAAADRERFLRRTDPGTAQPSSPR